LEELKLCGYALRATPEIPTSEYMRFDKGDPKVTHCLHLRTEQSVVAIATKNYLIAHLQEAKRYDWVKFSDSLVKVWRCQRAGCFYSKCHNASIQIRKARYPCRHLHKGNEVVSRTESIGQEHTVRTSISIERS
jgi:hypothetical protein